MSNELKHHGVKGQKWGVRRWQNSDGSLTPEGYIHYGYGKERKRAGDIDYSTGRNSKRDAFSELYSKKANEYTKERYNAPIDKLTGLTIKTKYLSEKEDLKRVNAEFYNKDNDGFTMNCTNCTTAYDLRKRGFEVAAGTSNNGHKETEVSKWYNNAQINNPGSLENMEKMILSDKNAEGQRGAMFLYFRYGGAHCVSYTVENNKLYIIDAQDGTKTPYTNYVSTMPVNDMSYLRLDNAEPNYKMIRKKGIVRYDGHN